MLHLDKFYIISKFFIIIKKNYWDFEQVKVKQSFGKFYVEFWPGLGFFQQITADLKLNFHFNEIFILLTRFL